VPGRLEQQFRLVGQLGAGRDDKTHACAQRHEEVVREDVAGDDELRASVAGLEHQVLGGDLPPVALDRDGEPVALPGAQFDVLEQEHAIHRGHLSAPDGPVVRAEQDLHPAQVGRLALGADPAADVGERWGRVGPIEFEDATADRSLRGLECGANRDA
jgi:hypothetical protein